jgi:hypothetical protein
MYSLALEIPAANAEASLEAWPAALLANSIPAGTIPLSFDNVNVLCCYGEWITTVRPISVAMELST